MTITLTVTVEVERTQGKFESKDTLAQLVADEIQSTVDGMDLTGDNEGEYTVTSVDVNW